MTLIPLRDLKLDPVKHKNRIIYWGSEYYFMSTGPVPK